MDSREKIEAELAKIKKINGVKALPPSISSSKEEMSSSEFAETIGNSVREISPEDLSGFMRAGWTFVDGSSNRAESGNSVYRRSDGQIVIAGPNLNVRLDADMSDEESRHFLSERGLSIKRQLKFAPNLFVVTTDNARSEDTVSLCMQLMTNSQVIYAEPSFIENIPGRNPEQNIERSN